MRRALAAVLAVWATLAIVAVLAWTHASSPPALRATPATVVVQGPGGTRHLARVLLLPAGSPSLASTHSSTTAPAAGGGAVSVSSAVPQVTTRSS